METASCNGNGNGNGNENGNADVLITPEDVLECLMNEGTIDAIRLKIIDQLKANEELKNKTMSMVEHSKVLNTPGSEKHSKRELFDALRHELEIPALERASKSVWELILDNDGLGKEINETVERVFCRLSGCEPPLLPSSDSEVQRNQVFSKDNSGSDRETERLYSLSRKRNFSMIDVQVEAAVGSSDPLPISVDSVPASRTVGINHHGKSIGAEPNRCHRNDGRSWRCTKDSLPNQKFCERHCKGKKYKKQLEDANEGISSKNRIDSSLKPSRPVTSKNNRRSHSKRQSILKTDASQGESTL